jgi:predicted MFS family arabinose efflux permease
LKVASTTSTAMLRPFLVDLGLSLKDIGLMVGTVGSTTGLLGALAGGALVNRLGRRRSLMLFGALQAFTLAAYGALAAAPPEVRGLPVLYALCAAEHFAGGMATAALFTWMMDLCRPESSATDYTVQASAVVIATGGAHSLSGFWAQRMGYAAHFTTAATLSLLALVAVALVVERDASTGAPRGRS